MIPIRIVDGTADGNIMSVVAFLVPFIFRHFVIMTTYDAMRQGFLGYGVKGHVARVGVIAKDIDGYGCVAHFRVNIHRAGKGIGKSKIQ